MIDTILIRYVDNGSSRYNNKEYIESTAKVRRRAGATGSIKVGEAVTIKPAVRKLASFTLSYSGETRRFTCEFGIPCTFDMCLYKRPLHLIHGTRNME